MAKVKNPLLSLGAIGRVTKAIVFVRRRKVNIAEAYPFPQDAKSLAQMSWRHMYQKAVALWHALSSAEQQDWQSQASRRHMTGFAWFMSQALKPNPGLYLPLQGGTMAGLIEMAGHHIHGLPLPVHAQDPLRVFEYNSAIAPYLYHEGARVYNSANISIPDNTWTPLTFNRERYDTDTIHDLTSNTSRLTCKTAGKYVIVGNIRFASSAVGKRAIAIYLNGSTEISQASQGLPSDYFLVTIVATIYDLAVNDYVELRVYQNSGGALNVEISGSFSPEFMMQRIGN